MSVGPRSSSAGRHLWSATPLIISISLLTFFVHSVGWLDWAETLGLDFFTHLRAPLTSRHALVVEITDDDYTAIFKRTSPLSSEVLSGLIKKIAAFKPRVIGVDLDTERSTGWDKLPRGWTGAVPVVWAQWPTPTTENGRTVLHPSPVLGGSEPAPCLEELGIGSMPLAEDGRVRRYARILPIEHRESSSLPWSVVKQFCLRVFADGSADASLVRRCEELFASENSEAFREHQVLPFASAPTKVSARAFLDPGDPASAAQLRRLVEGRAVLLGGGYSGQDSHFTADSPMLGVELMAEAVESEIQGKLVTPTEEKLMILAEVLGGYLLAAWHFWSHGRVSPWISRLLVPVLAFLISVSLFWSLEYWANFIPVLVGVSLHELWSKNGDKKKGAHKTLTES